jgi:serine/threonine protein kinase
MVGTVVGSFKITEKIGEGGMGAVYRGIDIMLEREVAIKMLKPELARQPQVVERFRSEAITLAKLNHPNIATLYSFIRNGEDYFMVMEYVRGETLDEAIRKFGAMAIERAVPLFCQALEGIDHAHRMGIIHRDIKPGNIMLTETGSIKVMDFGIARVLGTARMTKQGGVVGTVEYMSPEQVRSLESDARSDVYSLGILLYEMLTGRVPFNSPSEFDLMKAQIEDAPTPPRTFAAHISLAVEQAIMRALAKKPEARFQTAGEFRSALLTTMGAMTTPLSPQPTAYAAPVTRLLDSVTGAQVSGEISKQRATDPEAAKQTGLAGSRAGSPAANNTSAAINNEPQETIALGNDSRDSLVGAGHMAKPRARASKLNWKHYAAAACALLLLIGVPVALVSMRGSSAAPPEDASSAQPPSTPSPDQGATPATEQTAAEAGQAETGEAETKPEEGAATSNASVENANTASDSPRPARARSSRNENAAEIVAPENPAPAQPETASPPVATPPPPPPPAASEDNSASAAVSNKNTAKKQEKKGGIGGFFKRVFGGGDKKKSDNKNKP